jgi:hypothetical protein
MGQLASLVECLLGAHIPVVTIGSVVVRTLLPHRAINAVLRDADQDIAEPWLGLSETGRSAGLLKS